MRLRGADEPDAEHRSGDGITDLYHDFSPRNRVRRKCASVEKDYGGRQ
jgi:hypothetical protein